jgi:hypothetical protein
VVTGERSVRQYRLVDAEDVVVATFEAEDDEAATAQGRGAARWYLAGSRAFAVQRVNEGRWTDVAAWAPRPPFGQ